MHLAALYRNPSFSPGRHRENDTMILDAVVSRIENAGHRVSRASETEIEAGRIPAADGYLNMCQGPVATQRLIEATDGKIPVVNPGLGVLNCHRARMASLLSAAGLPFPDTAILPTRNYDLAALPLSIVDPARLIWVKRGDVHAQRADDVVSVGLSELRCAIESFAERGIEFVAVQAHVPGPVIKFYGVTGTSFFHAYAIPEAGGSPSFDPVPLERLACRAARALGLEAFGGDAAFPQVDAPVLIDVNDWPSYAPVRQQAAAAIAARVLHLFCEE